jgi:hypothetical protein
MKINSKWTLEMLVIEALKYRNHKDFKNYGGLAYRVSKKYGLITKICTHMDDAITQWTNSMLKSEALKYSTIDLFVKGSWSAYVTAQKRGILRSICSHMKRAYNEWTNKDLRIEANKYTTVRDFRKYSRKAYSVAGKRGILETICRHMKDEVIYWTAEMIRIEANKYLFRNEFKRFNNKAYNAARVRGILNKVCSHMKPACNSSNCENELFNYIKSVHPGVCKLRDRKVKIKHRPHVKGFDLDIYVPKLKKAIEFDGTYWHSFEGLKRSRKNWSDEDINNYHKLKDGWFASKGIKILHIAEADWYKNKDGCVKKCLSFLDQKK